VIPDGDAGPQAEVQAQRPVVVEPEQKVFAAALQVHDHPLPERRREAAGVLDGA